MISARQARPGMWTLGLLAAGAILLTGCASSHSAGGAPKSPATSGAMTPGMVMPDGSTMGAAAPAAKATAKPSVLAKPSAPAAMICSAEVRSDIATVLAVKQVPRGTSTFVNGLFTCRYALSMGPLVISVQESPDTAATTGYFQALRQRLGKTADAGRPGRSGLRHQRRHGRVAQGPRRPARRRHRPAGPVRFAARQAVGLRLRDRLRHPRLLDRRRRLLSRNHPTDTDNTDR